MNEGFVEKCASSALHEVQDIMKRIYDENPSYWPYGLNTNPGKGGEVYLVRDTMTKAAAGFIGWQVQKENGHKVGSYYVGMLPEYRGRGFAKEALAKILTKNASTVDEVRAYIMAHNAPSKALAGSLGLTIHETF